MERDEVMNPEKDGIIPGHQHSLWIDTTPDTDFPPLQDNLEVDVAIIGGGISGITAATLLKEAGNTVAVVDMHKITKLVTGHTTAKITSAHGIIYEPLTKSFGENGARIYADANQAAIERIASLVEHHSISCDFKRAPMYVYTESAGNRETIRREGRAAEKAGLPVMYTEETPLPFPVQAAVRYDNQAQFHPRKYLLALAQTLPGEGSHIFENTEALKVEQGDPHTVVTNKGSLKARYIIIATQFPFYDTGFFFSRLYPYYSYALGVRIRGDIPEGMYYTEDGGEFAVRNQPADKETLLVISGGHHKNGQGGDTLEDYRDLEIRTRERFDVESVDYFWSTEDYDTPDNVPFIGKAPRSDRIYLASGFGGWGMTNGTLSAMILSDMVLGRHNRWAPFFNPSRTNILASAKKFATENANVSAQYGKSILTEPHLRDLSELKEGEGKKFVINKREVAAYKDKQSIVHAVSPICTHLACTVNWNNAERTWDCPCHGSRFNYDGEVIHGPALRGLKKRDIEEPEEQESE
ncbi:MAG: FAD-dependent oxidoreductase [Candidatus Aquicultor sp.]